jgi:hypothetical protein
MIRCRGPSMGRTPVIIGAADVAGSTNVNAA